MNHQQLLEQEQTAAIKAQAEAEIAQGLWQIYKAHPEIKPCQANDQAIVKHFNGDDITLKDFDHDHGYGVIKGLALWSDQQKRDHLEKEIMKLLVASPETKEAMRQRYHSRLPLSAAESASGNHTGPYSITTAAMEEKLSNLRIGKDKGELSHEALVAEVQAQITIGGFPPLPSNTTKYQIRAWDVPALKKMIAKHGLAQINAVLAQQE